MLICMRYVNLFPKKMRSSGESFLWLNCVADRKDSIERLQHYVFRRERKLQPIRSERKEKIRKSMKSGTPLPLTNEEWINFHSPFAIAAQFVSRARSVVSLVQAHFSQDTLTCATRTVVSVEHIFDGWVRLVAPYLQIGNTNRFDNYYSITFSSAENDFKLNHTSSFEVNRRNNIIALAHTHRHTTAYPWSVELANYSH